MNFRINNANTMIIITYLTFGHGIFGFHTCVAFTPSDGEYVYNKTCTFTNSPFTTKAI